MRKLLNTLFITLEDAYLSLDGENVVVNREKQVVGRYPLHILSGIISFSYAGASPALMGACAKRDILLVFCTPRGKFLARTCGISRGNVLLRRTQYRVADDPAQSCRVARTFILGKVYNSRQSLERTLRDHRERIPYESMKSVSDNMKALLPEIAKETSMESLRGLEGAAATMYFGVFDAMLLNKKEIFYFRGRSRRPPLDRTNALLSLAYTLLKNDCASALEAVGLDSFVGFMHRDRPGRESLALDLMEEIRPCFADRFVLTLINNRMVNAEDFEIRESGAVYLKNEGRRTFLQQWQKKKQEMITHPYLQEKIPWGLVPYVQALLLSRFLRGDLENYPPFFWR
ncbi:MAG: type I-C CRISPR-associated endonuclease Cas1c [Eubacteriales bacterium]|nr:type I-C CRISPR-associated endonuclease Cas1c [Eubacteriales bacterium]